MSRRPHQITGVGNALRKCRADQGKRLVDMAMDLGVSVAMLSAVETGRKPMPDSWMAFIPRYARVAHIRDQIAFHEGRLKELRERESAAFALTDITTA